MLKGFKDFIMRGNVVDLAVAVVIGAAFGGVVTALVGDILNPLISGLFKVPDLSHVATWTVDDGGTPGTSADATADDAIVSLGAVLNAVINFLLVAAAIYFAIVFPLNKLAERGKRKEEAEPTPAGPTEIELLTEIRDALVKDKR